MDNLTPVAAVIDRATRGGKDRKRLSRDLVRDIRETVVLSLLSDGLSPEQIAQFVQVTPWRAHQLWNATTRIIDVTAVETEPTEAATESTSEDDEGTELPPDLPALFEQPALGRATQPPKMSKRWIAKLKKRYGPGRTIGESPEVRDWLATLEPTPADEPPTERPPANPPGDQVMSIVTLSEERFEPGIDKIALAIRDEIAELDVEGLRIFAVNLFRTCEVRTDKIAKALRCSGTTINRVPRTKWASRTRRSDSPSGS